MVVGHFKSPVHLRKHLDKLPVIYRHSHKAWFNTGLFKEWFKHHFVPEVIRFQTQVLNIPRKEVKALLILDQAPSHPSVADLREISEHIRVMYTRGSKL